jgi:hypothetical protein
MTVETRINEFAAQPGDSRFFPHIARADVVAGLRERLANRLKIDTSYANLCGPGAFFYCLVNDKPEIYVDYVIDLYNNGSAKLGSLTVKPSHACRNHQPDPKKIAPVDWVALASLKDDDNIKLHFSSEDDGAAGITMPHTMAHWFNAVGYQLVHNETNVFFTKGRGDINTVLRRWREGGRVCLFVNAKILDFYADTHRSFTPDHWVVMDGSNEAMSERVVLSVFSWGKIYKVPERVNLSIYNCLHNFYGYVSANATPH